MVLSKSISSDFVVPTVVKVNPNKFPNVNWSCFNAILLVFVCPEAPSNAVPEVVPITKLADISKYSVPPHLYAL